MTIEDLSDWRQLPTTHPPTSDRVRWLCDEAQKPARGKHANSNRRWWPAIPRQKDSANANHLRQLDVGFLLPQ
jgi:hypothetical protein